MRTCSKCKQTESQTEFGAQSHYCRACFSAYKRDWYAKHRQAEIERCAKYNKENPHVPAASMRRCRAKDPKKYTERERLRRIADPEAYKMIDAKKSAKRRALIKESVSRILPDEWECIKRKYSYSCAYCLQKVDKLTIDHVVPLSKGGSHAAENIVPACSTCNSSKHANDNFEFVARKFGRLI